MKTQFATLLLSVSLASSALGQEPWLNASVDFDAPGVVFVPPGPGLDVSDSFTIEAWVKPEEPQQPFGAVLTRAIPDGQQSSCYYGFGYIFNDRFHVSTGFGQDLIGPPITTGEWTHYAWTHENGQDIIYENGVPVTFGALPDPQVPQVPVEAFIGAEACQSPEFFIGELDEVRIWGDARTQEEINQLMNTQITTDNATYFDGLNASFPFEGDFTDATGNHDGVPGGTFEIVCAEDLPKISGPGTPFCFCEVDTGPPDIDPPDNNPDPNAGCANNASDNLVGCTLRGTGTNSIVDLGGPNGLTLVAENGTPKAFGIFFSSNQAPFNFGHGEHFYRGIRCFQSIEESGFMDADASGTTSWKVQHNMLMPMIGETFLYQYGYRDTGPKDMKNGFTRGNFNVSNAYMVTWCP